jgi:hypothetical protein
MDFLLDENDALLDVGIFADAGLQIGDVLISVHDGKNTWLVADLADRPAIPVWQFTEPQLTVNYEREGELLSVVMENPKAQ